MSNLTIELSPQATVVELICPECFQYFNTSKQTYKSAINHKQKNIFCSELCARKNRTINKEELAERIKNFHTEHGRVPIFKDFGFSSIYRRKFGNWTNALKFAGFDEESMNRGRSKPRQSNSQYWKTQRNKYLNKKRIFVAEKGGGCKHCGYNKNLAALTFHHTDPSIKTMSLDARSMLNISIEKLTEEMKHCDLLCANCHLEIHNPDHAM